MIILVPESMIIQRVMELTKTLAIGTWKFSSFNNEKICCATCCMQKKVRLIKECFVINL